MEWYTYKEIIEMLKISRQTLNNWRRNGNIIYKKISPKTFMYAFPKTRIIREENESPKNL